MKSLLKNGVLVDETSTLNQQNVSILIDHGQIIEVASEIGNEDVETTDLDGLYVSAGWIDMHVHCFHGAWSEGISPDRVGYQSGVTMLVDAGSSGADTVESFSKEASTQITRVKAMLNISREGLLTLHELRDLEDIDVDLAIRKARQYPDFIVGFKLRASSSVMGKDMKTPFIRAKQIQKAVNKPLMVHIGNFPPSLDDVLNSLDKGDIVTHCFNGKENGIIVNHEIRKSATEARNRGVLFDLGHGTASFSYEVAKSAKLLGFYPDTAGTDIYTKNVNGPVYSLAHCMSKLRELGYSLDDCISMNTNHAARSLNLPNCGSVKGGNIADLTIFKELERESQIEDSEGNQILLHQQIVPVAVVIDGKWRTTTYGNDEHIH
jgi:dihydroorotase